MESRAWKAEHGKPSMESRPGKVVSKSCVAVGGAVVRPSGRAPVFDAAQSGPSLTVGLLPRPCIDSINTTPGHYVMEESYCFKKLSSDRSAGCRLVPR